MLRSQTARFRSPPGTVAMSKGKKGLRRLKGIDNVTETWYDGYVRQKLKDLLIIAVYALEGER